MAGGGKKIAGKDQNQREVGTWNRRGASDSLTAGMYNIWFFFNVVDNFV